MKHIVLKVSFIYCSWKMFQSSKTIHLFVTKEMTQELTFSFLEYLENVHIHLSSMYYLIYLYVTLYFCEAPPAPTSPPSQLFLIWGIWTSWLEYHDDDNLQLPKTLKGNWFNYLGNSTKVVKNKNYIQADWVYILVSSLIRYKKSELDLPHLQNRSANDCFED